MQIIYRDLNLGDICIRITGTGKICDINRLYLNQLLDYVFHNNNETIIKVNPKKRVLEMNARSGYILIGGLTCMGTIVVATIIFMAIKFMVIK